MKHIKLFEEIGFTYSNKEEGKIDPFKEEEESFMTFDIDSISKPYKKIAKEAFNAGKTSTLTFDEWWNKVWVYGKKEDKKVEKTYNKIGFKTAEKELNKVEASNPLRPPKPPTRPPSKPRPETPIKRPRKGIWFEGEEEI